MAGTVSQKYFDVMKENSLLRERLKILSGQLKVLDQGISIKEKEISAYQLELCNVYNSLSGSADSGSSSSRDTTPDVSGRSFTSDTESD